MIQTRRLNGWIITLLFISPFVCAQTVEEDESSSSSSSTPSLEQRVAQQSRNQVDLLKQINTLNQQITELQGQIEVQSHDIKTLKEQQKTQYNDLDQRLNEASRAKVEHADSSAKNKKQDKETTKDTPAEHPAKMASAAPAASANEDAEQKAYQAAYRLLQKKHYDKAKVIFEKFIQDYPTSNNTINAHYWLGNIYLLKNQPSKAVTEFKATLKADTTHTKTADTLLKMGIAYAMQGNTPQARIQFKKVSKDYPESWAAKIAAEQLKGLGK